MLALVVGTLLALAALAYVLWPIIAAAESRPSASSRGPARSEVVEAVAPVPETAMASGASTEDIAEAEIRRARAQLKVCPVCGPRPEPGARYCSRCGRALA